MFFARAGGGGSGSSGGSLILMLPAAVSGGVAGFVKRKTRSKIAGFLVGVAVGLVFSLLYLADSLYLLINSNYFAKIVRRLRIQFAKPPLLIRYGSQIVLSITPSKFSRGFSMIGVT